jgi:arabinose-5-phosphate isomerase
MPAPSTREDAVALARNILETEARAILGLIPQLGSSFERALELLQKCTGHVVVTGMGKSGIIASKVAATLRSTGTAASFLHPAEALHGDLGVVQPNDVVIALSYSGETEELVRLLEAIRGIGARLISLTGSPSSTLGQASHVTLGCHVAEEACPMNLAPTASTTAMLALGDALALALSQRKGFREEQFANLHPRGRLGKRLMRVESLMHRGDNIPRVAADTGMPDDVMTRTPVTIGRSTFGIEALRTMEERKITSLIVVDSTGTLEGVVHLHDLW